MSKHGEVYDRVEHTVAKLYVLRDSCTGVIHTEKSNPNLIWFQGAELLLQEAVEKLQVILGSLETGDLGASAPAEETAEEIPEESDEEKEGVPTEKSE
jgi:hypothetical protein